MHHHQRHPRPLDLRATGPLLLWIPAVFSVLAGCGDNWIAGRGFDAAVRDGAPTDSTVVSDAGASDAGGGYTIVVLPDTQYYASSWPAIFDAQAQWIVDNRDAERIAFVLHTGDIVDLDTPAQWQPAAHSLHLLDGQVPYAITAGNHDYATLADRMGMINAYFPPGDFDQLSWFGGTFEPGHLENAYYLLPSPQGTWLVLALEFGPRDEVLAWASTILAANPTFPAIVITHAYLFRDGARYDRNRAGQEYNPHDYLMIGQVGTTINDGEEMWQKLVAPNPNVKLVFSGHDVNHSGLPPGTAARLTSARSDGSRVHQLLANYQTCITSPCERDGAGNLVHGGNGYLRLLRVAPDGRSIAVSTYSPFLDASLADAANQFTLDLR